MNSFYVNFLMKMALKLNEILAKFDWVHSKEPMKLNWLIDHHLINEIDSTITAKNWIALTIAAIDSMTEFLLIEWDGISTWWDDD